MRWGEVALLGCLFFGPTVEAGPIAELLSEGVLGTQWGQAKDEIAAKFPGGKLNTVVGLRQYHIRDSRKMFGIERNPSDQIIFSFDSEWRLIEVRIEFPKGVKTWRDLQEGTQQAFGPYLTTRDETINEQASMYSNIGHRWTPDGGVSVALTQQTTVLTPTPILTITKAAGVQSKSALGLE